ncbi:MAG: hypothetical protein M1820_004917 [Bogoriella megaspora]|nr:MAG: hypothetical protein M1820_004917 [Bogoriella megaspora]
MSAHSVSSPSFDMVGETREDYWDRWIFEDYEEEGDEDEGEEEPRTPRDSLSPLDDVELEKEQFLQSLETKDNASTRDEQMSPPLIERKPLQAATSIASLRVMKRNARPPDLKLASSNGATTWTSPLLPRTAPIQSTRTIAERDTSNILPHSATLGDTEFDLPIMGNNPSKDTTELEGAQPPRRKHTVFRRYAKSPPPPVPSQKAQSQTQSEAKPEVREPRIITQQPTQASHDSSNPNSAGDDSSQSHQQTPSTAPTSPAVETEEKKEDNRGRAKTPMMRLPTPSLMQEESPGQYGMGAESTPQRDEQLMPRVRPRSGTGADLFKEARNLQSTAAYLNNVSQRSAPTSRRGTTSTVATLTSLPSGSIPTLASHPRFSSVYSLPATPSIPAPAPPLTALQVSCIHSHRIMHRSRNTHAPVACMTCCNNDLEERWRCHWCYLRICTGCKGKLGKIEGRDVTKLVMSLEEEVADQEGDVTLRPSEDTEGKRDFSSANSSSTVRIRRVNED